ncbi:MAG: lipopolysaccharide biosynthesis protein [Siculibacillus sp.]|nr:lipopolysaccharide biosynthesis protein [Siculibacillus sp.]
MIAGFRNLLRDNPVLGAMLTLGMKVSGSGTALVMFALAARTMNVSDFGLLVIAFNSVSFLAVFAVLGQDTLILRSWGEFFQRSPALARGSVAYGLRVTVVGAIFAVVGFVGWATTFDGRLTASDLVAVAAFLFTQTLLHYGSNLTRAVRGVFHSESNRELTWRLPLAFCLAWALFAGRETSVTSFFAIAAAGQFAALVIEAMVVRGSMPASIREARAEYANGDWTRRSIAMTAAAMAEAANQYADVVLIGALAGPVASAGYFVAARIANVFPMLTTGLHSYSASRIAELYYGGRTDELQRLLVRVMMLALALAGLLATVIVVAGPWLLSLFGESYRDEYDILLILAGVAAFTTLAGPGSTMMLTMGREKLYLKLVLGALVVRILALVVLVPSMGILGAAIGVGIAIAPFAAVVAVLCARGTGIDPSIFGILRIRRDP